MFHPTVAELFVETKYLTVKGQASCAPHGTAKAPIIPSRSEPLLAGLGTHSELSLNLTRVTLMYKNLLPFRAFAPPKQAVLSSVDLTFLTSTT